MIKVNSIEISDDDFKAVVTVQGEISKLDGYRVRDEAMVKVAMALADKLMLQIGPDVLKEITKEQLINATIMRVAGQLTGDRQ